MKKYLPKFLTFFALLIGIIFIMGSEAVVYAGTASSSTYVLNKNTKKFHYYSCGSVSDMAEKNKIFSDETPEEIIAKGYSPCKKCHPELGVSLSVSKTKKSKAGISETCNYVLNKNTKKFHNPNCSSVGEIKKKNRMDSNLSRDEIINMGYSPCKRCKP